MMKETDIIGRNEPLKSKERDYERKRSHTKLTMPSFVEMEGCQTWEEYLKSIDLWRKINKKIS
ncbi:hypothetical protein GCM10022378_21920 [Salinicoccus jeotgali]|uniref:Uncharacterized protein n=1 Tax=Salinicoccus jeotgali TaxID=381634 RepID=A0ABP7F889_9STAP